MDGSMNTSEEPRRMYVTAGEIADEVGTTRQTIYHYESLGLITPSATTKKLRLFDPSTIDRVRELREMSKTYKLKAIKDVLNQAGVTIK